MMNKKGQVLVVFVLLLPLIILFLGLIVDVGNSLIIKKKSENIIKDLIIYAYRNNDTHNEEILDNDEQVEPNIEENEVENQKVNLDLLEQNIKRSIKEYESVKLEVNDDILNTKVVIHYKSLFSAIFNIGLNNINIDIKYDIKNKRIVRE